MKKFLPQDTLSIDVMTLGVMLLLFAKIISSDIVFPFNSILDSDAWLVIIGTFATLSCRQIMLNRLTPIKAILEWLFGVFFVWIAFINYASLDLAMLVLGLANLYSCVINFGLIKENIDA